MSCWCKNVLFKNFTGNITFPLNLPTSCLLGCVDVEDVLPQEEYRDMYPKGESGSPYVFICSNPQELLVKFPMQGQHKICKSLMMHKRGPSFFHVFCFF